MPSYDEDSAEDFFSSPEFQTLMDDNPQEPLSDDGPTEADVLQYLEDASGSGVDVPVVQTLKDFWSTGGKAVGKVTDWMKENKELTSMVTAGIGNAQKNKLTQEQLEQRRKWDLEDAASKKANEAELYDRRNQSVIGTKPAQMGILGRGMLDSHVDYLQKRK